MVPDKYGMTHVAISSRMIDWFSKQDAQTQKAIMMAEGGAGNRELAKNILKKMSS